jgi:predicted transcriptional regulator
MKIPTFTLRGFKRPRELVGPALGKLEREVMEISWRQGEISVRDVFLAFEKRIAYTTLMTTLHRLYTKGVLERRKQGRAFLYSPRLSLLELERGIAQDLIEGLIGQARDGVEPVLACIVDTVSEHDRASLDALDRLIREKKSELRRKH